MTQQPTSDPDQLPPPILVEDNEALRKLLGVLERSAEVAVDTEADSFFSYREQVCLVQVTAEGQDYVVDPFADIDLCGFGRFLADPNKVKVFHDGEYDVLILKRDHNVSFANLFDTRVAASALGSTSPGLASVLEQHFGVQLDKSMQRSDWSKRPLSEKQIRYARLDTHYLLPLMHIQREAIRAAGRSDVLEGECRRLEALVPPDRNFNPDGFAKLKGARDLGPSERRVLRELFIWRDEAARERDVPPFKVLPNNLLLAIAAAMPSSENRLARVPGFSPKLQRRLGADLIEVIQRARALDPIQRLPSLPAKDGTDVLSEEAQELHDRLKKWRKHKAIEEQMDSSLVLNRHGLLALAQAQPTDPAQITQVDGILPWQVERYGPDLIEVISTFEQDLANNTIEFPRRSRRRR